MIPRRARRRWRRAAPATSARRTRALTFSTPFVSRSPAPTPRQTIREGKAAPHAPFIPHSSNVIAHGEGGVPNAGALARVPAAGQGTLRSINTPETPGADRLTPSELEELLGPIALYPD